MLQKHLASGSSPWILIAQIKTPTLIKASGGKPMKIYLKGHQYFNQHLMQRKMKPSLHKTFNYYHFVCFKKRNITFFSSPHYGYIMEISAVHRFNLPLLLQWISRKQHDFASMDDLRHLHSHSQHQNFRCR